MRKSVAAVLVTAATMTGMGFAVMPASAVGSCDAGNICLFENRDYNAGDLNHWRDFRGNIRNFNDYNWVGTSDNMDNETSSIKNRRGCTVTLYQHIGYEGADSDFANGRFDDNLADNNIGENRASSLDSWCD